MEPVRLAPSIAAGLPDLDATLPDWHRQAACLNADPGMFFPGKGESTGPAKALCARCPVAAECLAVALAMEDCEPDRVGVWGGTSPNERRRIARHAA